MPYLLTAGNHPGSPASWVQTEDGNTSNAGITLPDNLMTSVTSHGGNTSSHFVENLGTNKVNIRDSRCVKSTPESYIIFKIIITMQNIKISNKISFLSRCHI